MATLLTWILRLFMGLMGLAFVLGLVAALGLYIVWATLRWLLTGRKPQVVLVWQQFSAMRKNFGREGFSAQSPWRTHAADARDDQVVDVEVREVVEDAPRLPAQPPR